MITTLGTGNRLGSADKLRTGNRLGSAGQFLSPADGGACQKRRDYCQPHYFPPHGISSKFPIMPDASYSYLSSAFCSAWGQKKLKTGIIKKIETAVALLTVFFGMPIVRPPKSKLIQVRAGRPKKS